MSENFTQHYYLPISYLFNQNCSNYFVCLMVIFWGKFTNFNFKIINFLLNFIGIVQVAIEISLFDRLIDICSFHVVKL